MPPPPEGEADLRVLARRYVVAERAIRDLLARAPNAEDRGSLLKAALLFLVALRRLDARTPVRTAYLHSHPFADPEAGRPPQGDSLTMWARVATSQLRAARSVPYVAPSLMALRQSARIGYRRSTPHATA
jgi:hypothetical protein